MRHSNPNMLLRIAQADAYAVACEYVKKKEHPELFEEAFKFERYLQHPTYHKLKPGMYTDDTQMSIAVAEVLMSVSDPKYEDFADAFFRCFKRDERDGYSRGFQAILEEAKDSTHMRSLLKPDSNKNGAAMRSVPLGVLRKPDRIVELAALQAGITHQTWGGVNSSIAVALMSHFALYDRRGFDSMYGWCSQYLPAFEYFREPWEGGVGHKNTDKRNLGVGMCTAHAVHTLLVEEKSLMGILRRTLEWGGDTDSVAAIAWGIASARYQDEVLPEFLERELEAQGNPQYGPRFLKDTGLKLMTVFP